MNVEIIIENKGVLQRPIVLEDIEWSTERYGSAGKLTFKVLKDATLNFQEGNAVMMSVDGEQVFYGFVFKKQRDKTNVISVTAYDQIIYLTKNKYSYSFTGVTAGDVITQIAEDFQLKTGDIADTGYKIATLTEDGQSLLDIILDAIDETTVNVGELYVLYDDYGSLTLKNISDMTVDTIIQDNTAEDFDYTSSIDDDTYNSIEVYYDNDETGYREQYIAKDSSHINEWGILQLYESLDDGESGQNKADTLLNLYNGKSRTLKVSNAFGDIRVRGGSMVPVILNLGDINAQHYMMCEKVSHTFKNDQHLMDLTLRGGEISG